MDFIFKKLTEKSTYAGLGIVLGLIGIHFSPEQYQAVGAAVLGIVGVFEVFRTEK